MNKTSVLIIFILFYLIISIIKSKRSIITWVFILLFMVTGFYTLKDILITLNWDVLGIFFGTAIIAEYLIASRLPEHLADKIVIQFKKAKYIFLFICLLTGFISAFLENVATVMIVAPLAFAICKKLDISPVPLIIGITISSNLQGAATLIGDPPSMILASYKNLSFMDFFIYQGKLSLFFYIQVGALASAFVLYYFFRKENRSVQSKDIQIAKIESYLPLTMLIALIISLIIFPYFKSFLPDIFEKYTIGILGGFWGIITIILCGFKKNIRINDLHKRYDWESFIFLAGIFIIVDSLNKAGILLDIKTILISLTGGNVLVSFILILLSSMILSGFIDNVPYIIMMLPVVDGLATQMHISNFLLIGALFIGTCIGGNITPIGASANVVGMGLLKKNKYDISFWKFIKYGFPFTLVATITAALLLWIVWY